MSESTTVDEATKESEAAEAAARDAAKDAAAAAAVKKATEALPDEFNSFLDNREKELDEEAKRKLESDAPSKKPEPQSKDAEQESVAEEGDQEDGDEEDASGDEAPAVDEALLERAVRAGLSIKDARAFPTAETLTNVVSVLEKSASSSKAEASERDAEEAAKAAAEKEKAEREAILAGIPDLDPEEYSEELVGSYKGLKDLVVTQMDAISDLKKQIAEQATKSAVPKGTWIDGEVARLGKDYVDTFGEGDSSTLQDGPEKAARERLRKYVEFVQADVEASGTKLSRADVFAQALSAAFGDKVKSVKAAAVKAAAGKRSRKALNQPTDTSGKFVRRSSAGAGTYAERKMDAIELIGEMQAKNSA